MGCRFPPARFPFVSMCADLVRRRLRLFPILGLAALGFAGCDSVSPSRVPTAVAFLTQPAGASGGTPFTTQPVVEVLDQNDERLAGTPVSVTVGLGSNPSGGQLVGVTTVITTTGLAAFGDLTIDKAGTGYTLVVSVRGAAASSAGFDVMVGPAKRLRFLAQPGGGLSATPLAVQPVVEVVDAGGNRETNQSGDATLSFGINPTAALLTGTVALASTSGLATFTDVAISRGGTGYRLIASAAGLAPDTSQALDVDIHFVNITVSTFLGCGLAIEGDAYCWGRNELGDWASASAARSSRDRCCLPVASHFAWWKAGREATRTASGMGLAAASRRAARPTAGGATISGNLATATRAPTATCQCRLPAGTRSPR